MSFKKPFRATPVRLGPYHRAQKRREWRLFSAQVLGIAAVAGLSAGALSTEGGARWLRQLASGRENAPPVGAYYSGCDDARAAGVAPLYAGEPGYRPEMDGDSDGIACEPYRPR